MVRTKQMMIVSADSTRSIVIPGPTTIEHGAFDVAFQYFNAALFNSMLPGCLITMQRTAKAYGFFHSGRFQGREGVDVIHEIALNPAEFATRSDREITSTLVHEMIHCWQAAYGTPSRNGYHNSEWAKKMEEIGLVPSHNGRRGGKRVGPKVSHYIAEDGPFDRACSLLLASGFRIAYVESDRIRSAENERLRKLKRESHSKFVCHQCGASVRGKPTTEVDCRPCETPMVMQT